MKGALTVSLPMETSAPLFWTVMDSGVETVFAAIWPKSMDAGVRVTVPPAVPVPLRSTEICPP